MKLLFYIIVLGCLTTSCKAQKTPLWQADPDAATGSYYKDLNNDLNEFESVWEWPDGAKRLTIKLLKKENASYFFEELVPDENQRQQIQNIIQNEATNNENAEGEGC